MKIIYNTKNRGMPTNKDLFKSFNSLEEQERVIKELTTEKTIYHISRLYEDLVEHHRGVPYRFLPWKNIDSDEYKKKLALIERFIRAVVEVGATFDQYMRAQFEQQMPYMKKLGMSFVPFRNMCTDRAKQRWFEYQLRVSESYLKKHEQRDYFRRTGVDIEESLLASLEALVDEMEEGMSEDEMVRLVEGMARRAAVTELYVYTFPLKSKSAFLTTMAERVEKKLDGHDRKQVAEVKAEILKEVCDGEGSFL